MLKKLIFFFQEYLSQNHFVHINLAARNILVGKDNIVKISNFGLTKKVSREMIYISNKNTHWPVKWMSIEAIFDQMFSMFSDVWVAFFSLPLIKKLIQVNAYWWERLKWRFRFRFWSSESKSVFPFLDLQMFSFMFLYEV